MTQIDTIDARPAPDANAPLGPPGAYGQGMREEGEHEAGAGQGSLPELERLMRAHNQRLFRIARGILKDDAAAEDVVQNAYVAAYTRFSQFEGRSSLSAWLSRITAHRAFDELRRRKREQRLGEQQIEAAEIAGSGPSSPSPEVQALSQELRLQMEDAVDALPEVLRSVLVMRDVEGMTSLETADALGIEEGTVRVRLHRARGRLKADLARDLGAHLPQVFAFAGERCDRIVARTLSKLESPGRGREDND